MSAVHLDAVDEKIIILLVEDARRSFADIGGRVGLTASAVKRRVDRLRSGGAIGGFTVRLSSAVPAVARGGAGPRAGDGAPGYAARAAPRQAAELLDPVE